MGKLTRTIMGLLQTTRTDHYKGHEIARVESPLQTFFVVDGNYSRALWSVADAKRMINGKDTLSEPVDIQYMND